MIPLPSSLRDRSLHKGRAGKKGGTAEEVPSPLWAKGIFILFYKIRQRGDAGEPDNFYEWPDGSGR